MIWWWSATVALMAWTTVGVHAQADKPLIAFAGQSNVIGHNTDGASSDRTQYQGILDILGNGSLSREEKKTALTEKFLEADEAELYPEVSSFMADKMLEFVDRGLMENIQDPLDYATCSFVDPGEPGQFPAVPVSPDSYCGFKFGSELMFARSLYSTGAPWNSQNFEIPKVAKGGTEIYNDWNINNGRMWKALNNTIHSTVGTWRALVWHQGENDCFIGNDQVDTSLTYEGNLTALMNQAREEMHSTTPFYASAKDIPIAIVRIHWPDGPAFRATFDRVVEAQRNFVQNDPRATFVDTSDLKGNYHLNAGGLFIVGDRIAQQLAPLMNEIPESSPTPAPVVMPTPAPFPQTSPPPTNQDPIYINCGGPLVEDGPIVWMADTYFLGGKVHGTAETISGTNIPEIYQTERYAALNLVYEIPVQNGLYDVTLHFAEIWDGAYGSNIRVFDVRIENQLVFDDIDIYNEAGGENKAYIKFAPNVDVSDGFVTIELEKGIQNPKVNAISVVPAGTMPTATPAPTPQPVGPPPPKQPLYIDCGRNFGEGNYFDGTNTWVPDSSYVNGPFATHSTMETITGTVSQDVYNTERYDTTQPSTMKYSIELESGYYDITLHMSEIYFDAPGKRVFGVKLEGNLEIPSIDVFAKSGGKNIKHDEIFLNYPVLDGSFDVEFVRIIQNPNIHGISIVPADSGGTSTTTTSTTTKASTTTTSTTPATTSTTTTTTPTTPYGVTGFVLVDGDTDEDVPGGFSCLPNPVCVGATTKFNIRAETFGTELIGSVFLTLSGETSSGTTFSSRTEGISPYALFGDIPLDNPDYIGQSLELGSYTVTAQAFPLPNGGGTGSAIASLDFTIGPSTTQATTTTMTSTTQATTPTTTSTTTTTTPTTPYYVTGFVLVDGDTDEDVPGGFDCLPNPVCVGTTTKFNIRATTYGTEEIGSVLLTLSGTTSSGTTYTSNRTEGVSPYALFGDIPGDDPDYAGQSLEPGSYTVTAQAFPLPNGEGIGSAIASLDFTIAADDT